VDCESVDSINWRFTVFYCDEHAEEIEKGVPIGPVGLDTAQILIEPLGTKVPRPGGLKPGPA
jgi:hypothetical protein